MKYGDKLIMKLELMFQINLYSNIMSFMACKDTLDGYLRHDGQHSPRFLTGRAPSGQRGHPHWILEQSGRPGGIAGPVGSAHKLLQTN